MSSAQANAKAWYDTNIAHCPRSAEWKHGALAGSYKAHGVAHERSPWAGGTAQDDARTAGFQFAHSLARHDLKLGDAF